MQERLVLEKAKMSPYFLIGAISRALVIGTYRALESGSGCEIKINMIDHPVISEILCYTHLRGAGACWRDGRGAGMMEELSDNRRRLVVGTLRESVDESAEWIVNS